jgi:hypothetical protein
LQRLLLRGGRRFGALLGAEVLQAKEDHQKEAGEYKNGARVLAAALLIRISYLCQTAVLFGRKCNDG